MKRKFKNIDVIINDWNWNWKFGEQLLIELLMRYDRNKDLEE